MPQEIGGIINSDETKNENTRNAPACRGSARKKTRSELGLCWTTCLEVGRDHRYVREVDCIEEFGTSHRGDGKRCRLR